MTKMIEVNRGYDNKSINKHSWREFSYSGSTCHYIISRCLDANPPYFEAMLIEKETGKVITRCDFPEGSRNYYFCDGQSWSKAIEFFEEENFNGIQIDSNTGINTNKNQYDCEYCD